MSTTATVYNSLSHILDALSYRLHNADSSDFGFLAVAVIVTVWYVTRYFAD